MAPLSTTISNTASSLADTIKKLAIKTYNKTIKAAKQKLMSLAQAKLDELDASISALITKKFGPIIDKIKLVKSLILKANTVYDNAKKVAKTLKDLMTKTKIDPSEIIEEAAKIVIKKTVGVSVSDVDIGVTEKKGILATIVPEDNSIITLASDDIGLHVKFKNAKVKLNSIDELVAVVTDINNHLDIEDVSTTRAWVHKIMNTHPLVDEKIKDLDYFKPISNEVGVTYLRHTPDTQTLALEDWSGSIPKVFRRSLEHKMDSSYETINSIYNSLNANMSRNISTEFFYERGDYNNALKDQGNNILNKSLFSNDYHIAGDYTFRSIHINTLYITLITALLASVGFQAKLINWLFPVNTYDNALGGLTISIEGNEVKVNLKGDKVGTIATVIDKTPISALGYK
jgi:hypothetical protein